MMFPKENAWRCPAYLKWVKKQPSIISRMPADDPHHIIGHEFGGMGTTAPDWAVIPLTRGEHTELHNDPKAWEQRYGSQADLLLRFWRLNFDEIKGFFSE